MTIIDTKIEGIWKDYKYCLLSGSRWTKLYKTKRDFIIIFSTETDEDEVITMRLFNEITDYYANTPFGFLSEYELLKNFSNKKML
jgi:hypothetical protein